MGVRVSKSRYEAIPNISPMYLQYISPMYDVKRLMMVIEGAVLERLERFKVKVLNSEVKEAERLRPVDPSYTEAGYFFPPPKNKPIDLVRAIKVHGVVASDNSLRNTSFCINHILQEVIANQEDHTGFLLLVDEDDRVARADFEIYLHHFDSTGLQPPILGYSFCISTISSDSLEWKTLLEIRPYTMPTQSREEYDNVNALCGDILEARDRHKQGEGVRSPRKQPEEEASEEQEEGSIDYAMAYGALPEDLRREPDRAVAHAEKEDEPYDPHMAYGYSYPLDQESKRT